MKMEKLEILYYGFTNIHWLMINIANLQEIYSRRFATATARTASLGSHSRGMIQGWSGKWSGGVEARRALLSDGLPSHEGSPVVTMGVFNTKSWSNGRFGANIAP